VTATSGASDQARAGTVTKTSPRTVGDTVDRLLDLLASKGQKVFVVIDQRAEARAVGLELRETTLVVFGNPTAGTGVMDAAPLLALDLPLKILVWADGDGVTQVSYTDPAFIAARHDLSDDVVAPLHAIHGLTEALVAG